MISGNKEIELNERRVALEKADVKIFNQITEIGKLLKKPSLLYGMASEEKKSQLIKSLVENFIWNEGNLMIHWKKEIELVANRPKILNWQPHPTTLKASSSQAGNLSRR